MFITTGETGLQWTRDDLPNLIILHLLRPWISGTKVTQNLRETGIVPDVPLIGTTLLGKIDSQTISDCLDATAIPNKQFSAQIADHLFELFQPKSFDYSPGCLVKVHVICKFNVSEYLNAPGAEVKKKSGPLNTARSLAPVKTNSLLGKQTNQWAES